MENSSSCNCCNLNQDSEKIVVGRGNPCSRLMIIGEAPGAKEDELGQPFVGRSGKLLDDLLESVGIIPQQETYICNVVKCRPPNNRRPTKTELKMSIPWLYQQIKIVNPSIILLVGSTAVESVLEIKNSISSLRGKWQTWEGIMVMPVFHPSYLLRNPSKAKGSPFALTKKDLLCVRFALNDLIKTNELKP